MSSRIKNQRFVIAFILFVVGFTGLMTFYVGPKMMALRHQVAQDQFLFKCQRVVDGSRIEVQLRGWERPNTHPVFQVRFAGLNTPPLTQAEGRTADQAVIDWAEAHNIHPDKAAEMGVSVHKTLLAFIRKQNLFLYRADGSHSSDTLAPESRVHVLVSGTNVNLKLLESGLALHDTSEAHAFSDLYAAAQEKARAAGRGLWSEN